MRRFYRFVALVLATASSSACHSDGITAPLSSSTLVFTQNDAAGYSVLYSIKSDGSDRRQLTPSGSQAVTFAIAPDARQIAVSIAGSLTDPVSILDRNGNVTQKVPSPPPSDVVNRFGGIFDVMSWSRSGKLLVGGRDPDLGELTTSGEFYGVAPDNMSYGGEFSPDGSRIAFGRSAAHGTEVAVMNADGSNIQMLTSGNGGAGEPAWSPDGRRIAFTRLTSFTVGTPVPTVIVLMYVMNADGSGLVQISPDSVFDTSPTWSPDGQHIAVLRSKDSGNNFEIYIMNTDGSNAHAITSDAGLKHWLRWSPHE